MDVPTSIHSGWEWYLLRAVRRKAWRLSRTRTLPPFRRMSSGFVDGSPQVYDRQMYLSSIVVCRIVHCISPSLESSGKTVRTRIWPFGGSGSY